MAMDDKRWPEEQHLASTVVVLGGVANLVVLVLATFCRSSGSTLKAIILLNFGHSRRSQSFPAQVSQSPPGSSEMRTHKMAFSKSPSIGLVLVRNAIQKVEHLLAKDCQVGKIEDKSARMPAVWAGVATLAAAPLPLPHHLLLLQSHQSGSWQLVCPYSQ